MAKKKSFSISNNLTKGLEETVSAAQNYSGDLRVEIVPLTKIELDPDNPRDLAITPEDIQHGLLKTDSLYQRKKQELERLQSLAATIRDQGIINPVLIYKHGEKYRLVAGERRTLASWIAGKSDIQAKVLDQRPSPLKLSILQWVENIEREDLTLWERLSNLNHIMAAYAQSHSVTTGSIKPSKIAELIGCSLPHAMNYRAVLSASETLKLLIKENKIKNLEKAAVIAKIADLNRQDYIIQACLNGATLGELKAMAEQQPDNIEQWAAQKLDRRGRVSNRIQLGVTEEPQVIKRLLTALLETGDYPVVDRLLRKVDWNDFKSVSDIFRKCILILEDQERADRKIIHG